MEKLWIIDDQIVIFRPNRETTLVNYDKQVIRNIMKGVEKILARLSYDVEVPQHEDFKSVTKANASKERTVTALRKIAAHYERAAELR